MAQICLTMRLINQIETRVSHSDPILMCGDDIA